MARGRDRPEHITDKNFARNPIVAPLIIDLVFSNCYRYNEDLWYD